jgi:hypothetical protein
VVEQAFGRAKAAWAVWWPRGAFYSLTPVTRFALFAHCIALWRWNNALITPDITLCIALVRKLHRINCLISFTSFHRFYAHSIIL